MTSFVTRKLNFTFTLGTGTFGNTGANTVKVTGLRATTAIVKAGGVSMGDAQTAIFGLPPDLMNQLSTLGLVPMTQRRNSILIEAGDDISGMSTAFQGTILDAYADFNGAPDSPFHVTGKAGFFEAMKSAAPSSYRTTVDAAQVMSDLAGKMGLAFENNGVSVQLATPYFPGTARDQALECARAGQFNWIIDNGKLAIWPRNKARAGTAIVSSAPNGQILYPTFNSFGVSFRTIYNPALVYGATVQTVSSLKPANRTWHIYRLAHNLESDMPGGKWESTVSGASLSVPTPI